MSGSALGALRGARATTVCCLSRLPRAQDAYAALVACPTASIHTAAAVPRSAPFPRPAPGSAAAAAAVLMLGHTSPKSFGAMSYLVRLPGGNVMIDSPRWSRQLAEAIDGAGGVAHIVLTHAADAADAHLWAQRFGAARVLHEAEAAAGGGGAATRGVEVLLKGGGPWDLVNLGGAAAGAAGGEMLVLHTPGHTPGSCSLLLRSRGDQRGVLFSGAQRRPFSCLPRSRAAQRRGAARAGRRRHGARGADRGDDRGGRRRAELLLSRRADLEPARAAG